MTIPQKLKPTLTCCDSILCSVFRPANCGDWLLQEAHILWVLPKRSELFWAMRERSHRPPCSPAHTAAGVQCFPQSFRVSIGAVPHPFPATHGLRIVSRCPTSNCHQNVVN